MKKLLLIVFMALGAYSSNVDGANLAVPVQIVRDQPIGNGNTLAPPRPWYIFQDDYVLTLPGFGDDYALELRDEDGTVAYSTDVSAGITTVVLPSTLSGEYELRLIPFSATYYYRGYLIF